MVTFFVNQPLFATPASFPLSLCDCVVILTSPKGRKRYLKIDIFIEMLYYNFITFSIELILGFFSGTKAILASMIW
jgi:hypothetical protein